MTKLETQAINEIHLNNVQIICLVTQMRAKAMDKENVISNSEIVELMDALRQLSEKQAAWLDAFE